MADIKQLMPHIRRLAVTNILMILYFFSPSFLSFVAIVVALFVIIFDNPYETFNSLMNHSKDSSATDAVNSLFSKFASMPLIQQILWIVATKLFIEFTWLLPTWLVIFIAVEIYGSWSLLREFGVLEMAGNLMSQGHELFHKVFSMIPKHSAK